MMNNLRWFALGVLAVTSACSSSGSSGIVPLSPGGTKAGGLGTNSTRPAAVASAPAGWATTATQALSLTQATDLGAVPSSKSIKVTLGLQMRNADQLKSAVGARMKISGAQFLSTYAPTASAVSQVTGYLQSQGFSNITVTPNNLLVSATAPAGTVQTAFNTKLESFSQNGLTVFANVQPAYVPSSLGGTVTAVLGLNDAVRMSTPKVTQCIKGSTLPSGAPCVRFYDPQTFNAAYNAGSVPDASNSSIAIMTSGDTAPAVAWWRINESKFNMPQVPLQTVVVGLPSPADPNGTGEWNLDLTYSQAMTGYNLGQMYIYQTTSLTDSDIALEYNRWVTDDAAVIGNSSFGGCEFGPYLDGSMLVMDMILLQGAAQGQTMFVSTGDSGSFCSVGVPNGVPAGAPFTEYPASSPYVVAVGGTDLFSNADGSYKGETSWESGGGGLSQFEYSPYWEAGVQPQTAAGSFRGLPDIAYDASLETGALIYEGQTQYITGGTSLSSPMMAGVYARFQSDQGNALGFAPPLYYSIFKASTAEAPLLGPPTTRYVGPFHDILQGTNGLYQALPNYDYTTGMGSIDITRMHSAINGVAPAAATVPGD